MTYRFVFSMLRSTNWAIWDLWDPFSPQQEQDPHDWLLRMLRRVASNKWEECIFIFLRRTILWSLDPIRGHWLFSLLRSLRQVNLLFWDFETKIGKMVKVVIVYKYESCPLSFNIIIKFLGWKLSELLAHEGNPSSPHPSSSPSASTWVLRSRTKKITSSIIQISYLRNYESINWTERLQNLH